MVTSEPDKERGERIIAFVALAGGGSLAQLTAYYCKTEFCRYMQPPRCEVRGRLPQVPNGKHDLAAVRGEGKPI